MSNIRQSMYVQYQTYYVYEPPPKDRDNVQSTSSIEPWVGKGFWDFIFNLSSWG